MTNTEMDLRVGMPAQNVITSVFGVDPRYSNGQMGPSSSKVVIVLTVLLAAPS